MEGRLLLSVLWSGWRAVANAKGPVHVPGMPAHDIRDRWNRVRRYAEASTHVVPGNVVRYQHEAGRECAGSSEGTRTGKLPNGMDVAA